MFSLEVLRHLIAGVLTLVLIWAAVSDVIARKIPNRAVLAVLALYVVWAFTGTPADVGSSLIAGALGFAIGYGFYAFGVMGAGDAKLFAAVALFAGLNGLATFALATVLSGGALALISLVTRPRRAVVMFTLRGKGDFGRGVPYGVAIAFGGVYMIWGLLTGVLPRFG